MRAFPTRPMVLLEARHVSVCLHTYCHSTDAMAAAAAAILARHGWKQAAFMGHSYGTFVLSRIAQLHRPLVQSMVRAPVQGPSFSDCSSPGHFSFLPSMMLGSCADG